MESLPGLMHTWQSALTEWAAIAATIGLAAFIRRVWRASIGKGRYFTANYRRLAPHVRHEYVKGLFGEPAWEHSRNLIRYESDGSMADLDAVVRVWPLGKMGYLVTWCTSSDEVIMYGLSTRSRWFRPRIGVGPNHSISLGKSRLAELPDPTGPTGGRYAAVGARRFSYAEVHFFGNPGGYRTWIVGVSDAADHAVPPVGLLDMNTGAWDEDRWMRYRANATINSVLIRGMGAPQVGDASLLPYGVGPDLDTVRLMDANTSPWAHWRQYLRH